MKKNRQDVKASIPLRLRRPTVKRLPAVFGMLVAVSILLSFQGTQWSAARTTPTNTDNTDTFSSSSFHLHAEMAIAPVRQEAALRSTEATKSNTSNYNITTTTTRLSSKITKSTVTAQKINNTNNGNNTFAACLLIKDDNDILNEWIAYHYHVLNLRFLIVATDPFSTTSPSALLELWRQPPFDMNITEWNDQNYMPDYFLQGRYDRVPSFLPAHVIQNPKSSIWHKHEMQNPDSNKSMSVKSIKEDLVKINNHRFRQATFVSQCFRTFQQQKNHNHHRWVIHIDTDEYVVINPRLRARPRAVKDVTVPPIPHAGSILEFLKDMYQYYPKRLLPSCLMMPTILFGATENYNATLLAKVPPLWNHSRFESLRWTYHANLKEGIANGLQKAIVDVSTLPDDHPIFVTKLIKSVHQPLDSTYEDLKNKDNTKNASNNNNKSFKQICRQMTLKPDVDAVRLFPLTTNHYVGSLERYTARQDLRRNLKIYYEKANVTAGVDDGWIQGWLASFVESHGMEASQRVLGEYRRHNE